MAYTPRVWLGASPRISESIPGMVVTLRVINVPEVMQAVKKKTRDMERAAKRGVKKATKFLLEETLKVTPYDTGVLYRSGATAFQDEGFRARGIVYFDDIKAPYAIYVHEDLTKYHKPPTMAKFLQRTLWKNRGRISRIIQDEIRQAMR